MKHCHLCRFSRLCNPLPGVCIVAFYLAIVAVAAVMGYLFIVEEIL